MNISKGFTLVELVVVITIIGIISTVGIMSYRNTLKESRDQKRVVNLQNVRASLELYRNAQPNSTYPTELNLLPPAGFPLPVDPLSGLDTVYSYTPLNVSASACDNSATYCATYTLTTNLETLGVMYEVTPNTERIIPL